MAKVILISFYHLKCYLASCSILLCRHLGVLIALPQYIEGNFIVICVHFSPSHLKAYVRSKTKSKR